MADSRITIRVWHPDGELLMFKNVATWRVDDAGVLRFVLKDGVTEETTNCKFRITQDWKK